MCLHARDKAEEGVEGFIQFPSLYSHWDPTGGSVRVRGGVGGGGQLLSLNPAVTDSGSVTPSAKAL